MLEFTIVMDQSYPWVNFPQISSESRTSGWWTPLKYAMNAAIGCLRGLTNSYLRFSFFADRRQCKPNPLRRFHGACGTFTTAGKDERDKNFERHGERLMVEMKEETRILHEYFKKASCYHRFENGVSELIASRGHWPENEKLTPEEVAIVESIFGPGALRDIQVGYSEKFGDSLDAGDLMTLQFQLLQTCKMLPPSLVNKIHSIEKKPHFGNILDSLSDVHVSKGLPGNDEVIAHFQHFKKGLKQGMKSAVSLSSLMELSPFGPPLRSPFGPVSSSAGYEELRKVQLMHLVNCNEIISGSKILLRNLTDALVSPSKIITTVVQDELGQCLILQIHNVKNLTPTVDGVDFLPVGALYYLRNPFLKIGLDGWYILRVDQPFDLELLDIPPLRGNVMVVGDGDFSFSVALSRQNRRRGTACIVTSSLDTKDEVVEKYKEGAANLAKLLKDGTTIVRHEVDATEYGSLGIEQWDSVVWNFPYPTNGSSVSAERMKPIIFGFFKNLAISLKEEGRAYVTLAPTQGGTSRESAGSNTRWDTESLAAEAGLELVEVLPFNSNDFDGYEPKRAYCDISFPHDNSRTHILRRRMETDPSEVPSERSVLSRLANMLLDQVVWDRPPSHIHVPIDQAMKSLLPHINESPIALRLMDCAKKYKELLSLLLSVNQKEKLSSASVAAIAANVTELTYEIFTTDNGDLIVKWDSAAMVSVAACCVRVTMVTSLLPYIVDTEVETLVLRGTDAMAFGCQIRDIYGAVESSMASIDKEVLAKAVFSMAYLELYQNAEVAIRIVDAWLEAIQWDAWLYYFRASSTANTYFNNAAQNMHIRLRVLDDLHRVFDLIGNNKENDLYQRSLYALASVHRNSVQEESLRLAVSLYDHYIDISEESDRFLPAAHYHSGILKFVVSKLSLGDKQNGIEQARFHYQQGLIAEKNRLAFFGPVVADSRYSLSLVVMSKKKQEDDSGESQEANESLGESREELGNDEENESSANIDSLHYNTAAREVRQLLDEADGDVYLGAFRELYRNRFGKELVGSSKGELRAVLEKLSLSGEFNVTLRDRSSVWLQVPPAKTPRKKSKKLPPRKKAKPSVAKRK